ncbi:MAG: hypothetical protein P1U63_01470 [Coxiellaceae bacterium]|nr:hypothetical protein [Coxiellaceae bacterium]
MNKWFIPLTALACSATAMTVNAAPNYMLLPNIQTQHLMATQASKGIAQQANAVNIAKQALGLNDSSPYKTIRIRTIYNQKHQLSAVITYLLSDRVKGATIMRINLNDDQHVTSVVDHYRVTPADLKQSPNYATKFTPVCPDPKVQFVIGNNFTGDASVKNEVQKVYKASKAAGYNTFLMTTNNPDGPQPTVHAYENWMSCKNVKGFYNESHGSDSEILLSDGDFTNYTVDTDLVDRLQNKVVLLDSCDTFNDPLLSAMTAKDEGDSQQYIAGIVPLPFGSSERTASCFWLAALNHQPLNQQLIENCAKNAELDPEAFRIQGDGNSYLRAAV